MPKVLIPLAQGCEELEAVTLIDLLRRAEIEVVTAGLDGEPVRGSRGTVLLPDANLEDLLDEDFDMIALPGGMPGMENLRKDGRVAALLKKVDGESGYLAAICASPVVLADAGLLRGKSATCYPGFLDGGGEGDIRLSGEAVVRDGRVITSRGPGTAIDFALELIEILTDAATRQKVEGALQRS